MKPVKSVLVIKLSALGDFVMAFPAFARIRAAHPDARITLLTTPPFETLAKVSPYFDAIETDGRPSGPGEWLALVGRLRRARHDRVYDLQNNDRTHLIFQALRPWPPAWSGDAPGAGLPHRNPARAGMHPLERHAEQLGQAGIWPDAPTRPLSAAPPDICWILEQARWKARPGGKPPRPSALLIPGSSAQHPEKRWPVKSYGQLAGRFETQGFDVLIVGGLQEGELARGIQRLAPRARDLTGRTDFAQTAALGGRAAVAVGNDTGPVHLIAAAGAPTIVLFSSASSPELSAPRGHVTVFQAPDLADVPVETVLAAALSLAATS
ncbi:MAG TPA: glycosyltransferase family 9 protein [Caulobacteraceae bacterium]|jgi:ADP-heptose:LPS heptosyltransferase|nr:glycosyltransferase family 9 protein [Caulobacteraceae bacterium]